MKWTEFLAALLFAGASAVPTAALSAASTPISVADYHRAIELYHRILAERTPGAVAPPVDFLPATTQAKCDAAQAPRTHAVLVAATDLGLGQRFLMKGTTNDVSLWRSVLEDKGVAPSRIHVLIDDDARRDRVVDAFRTVLAGLNCNDRVIVHFSTHAIELADLSQGTILRARDTADDPAVSKLFEEDAIKSVFERVGREALQRGEPGRLGNLLGPAAGLQLAGDKDLAILLDDDSPTYNEIIRGRDVSDFMVAVRSVGAHAIASFDTRNAARARIEERQVAAGDTGSFSFQYEGTKSAYWPEPELRASPGSYTVLYATDENEVTPELGFPNDVPKEQRTIYGLFTFVTGSELLDNRYATPRSVAEAIKEHYSTTNIRRPRPIVKSSEPDLVIIAEVAPQAADPIKILSPKPTRGAATMEKAEVEIKGSVSWSAPVLGVMIDGAEAILAGDGSFSHTAALKHGMNNINIVAVTADSRLHKKTLELVFEGDRKALEGEGRRYAVVIANQTYGGATGMASLATPFADAEALAVLLQSKYGFATEIVLDGGRTLPLLLKDAGKRDIEFALHQLGKAAGAKDTVLIYYAGHGVFEQVTQIAYWVPGDAEQGFEPSYLSAADISAAIQRIQANHVILISDSCYSGALLRGGESEPEEIDEAQRMQALLKLQSKKSRIVVTSGNNEPVADLGGGGHSVFARALLTGLEKMDHDAFSARELFDGFIVQQVTANSDQEPQYRPLEKVGHEGGDFVFVKAEQAAAAR